MTNVFVYIIINPVSYFYEKTIKKYKISINTGVPMGFVPMPEKELLSLDGLRFELRYQNHYHQPDDPALDDSHIHPYYEIYLNLSGEVSFLVNNRIYPVRRGDLVITRPGDVHLCILQQPCRHEHVCLWLEAPVGHPALSCLAEAGLLCPSERLREEIIMLFGHLGALQKEMPEPQTTACLLSLLAAMAAEPRQADALPAGADIPGELQNILDVINTDFCSLHSASDLLQRTYVSPATLNRWFRRYVHLTPRAFIEAKKLAYAKALLQGGCSVSEASESAGFSDCSYFISVFRRRFGETPLHYKLSLPIE